MKTVPGARSLPSSPGSAELGFTGTHVDTFIDDYRADAYARWFFTLQRLPAALKNDFRQWITTFKLFCTYEHEGVTQRYRCIGCSRLGDVWLTTDFTREFGYDLRVDVAKCRDWSQNP